jgi:hypothetical protein
VSRRLPHVLAEIAEVAGEDAALAIAAARGGTTVYIPPAPASDHWLSRAVGQAKAKAIAERLTCGVGGMRIDLPLGPQTGHLAQARAKVDRMIAEGEASERDIARAAGYTIRGVRKRTARAATRRDDPQLKLL